MQSKLVPVGLALIAALFAVLYWPSQRDKPVAPAKPPEKKVEKPVPEKPKTPEVKANTPEPEKKAPEKVATKRRSDTSADRIQLPDGTTVPVLNGAYGAPRMNWPHDVPWSPIIGKETDTKGLEWYVHKDGSKSITQMVYHSQHGRYVPSTNVYNPKPALPMEPSEKAAIEEAMRKGAAKAAGKSKNSPPPTPKRQ